MLSRLQRMYAERGPVVALNVGPFKMVNLFGPDANRLVLLDRDRIFSARQPWMMIMGRIFPNGLRCTLVDGTILKMVVEDREGWARAVESARARATF